MPDMPMLMGPQGSQPDSSMVVTDNPTQNPPPPADRGWWQDACRVWGEQPSVPARPIDSPTHGS